MDCLLLNLWWTQGYTPPPPPLPSLQILDSEISTNVKFILTDLCRDSNSPEDWKKVILQKTKYKKEEKKKKIFKLPVIFWTYWLDSAL